MVFFRPHPIFGGVRRQNPVGVHLLGNHTFQGFSSPMNFFRLMSLLVMQAPDDITESEEDHTANIIGSLTWEANFLESRIMMYEELLLPLLAQMCDSTEFDVRQVLFRIWTDRLDMAVVTARVLTDRLNTRLFSEVRLRRRQSASDALSLDGRLVRRIRRYLERGIPHGRRRPNPMDTVD